MPKKSAGILLYRIKNEIEFLLVHPGGPFWAKKDAGSWSIPKGEFEEGENALQAAIREFKEEIGMEISGDFIELKPVKISDVKTVYPFALKKDIDASKIISNTFTMEWPPKSGKMKDFPEVDRGEWFNEHDAKLKINKNQLPILEELLGKLGG